MKIKTISFWSGLIIAVIIFFTPLVFSYFYPLDIGLVKLVFFRIFWWLLLLTTFGQLIISEKIVNLTFFKQTKALCLLIIFLMVSLFFSFNPWFSWFGSYDRQEGVISWLYYLTWFWFLVLYFNSYQRELKIKKIKQFLKIISISGLLVSLYAVLQRMGIDFVSWAEPAKLTGRAFSFLGQPNFLACWLVLVIPLSFYLFLNSLNKSRYFWLIIFIFELGALLITGSRAVVTVFLITSIIFLFFYVRRQQKITIAKVSLLLGGFLVFLLSFLAILFFSNKDRFLEIANPNRGSFLVRQQLLTSGFKAFLKKPWFGYGLENQGEAYAPYYKSDWAYYAKPDTYSDRAHNIVLDILLTSGIFGLVISLFFAYWLLTLIKKSLNINKDDYLVYFLTLSLTTYLISLLFNFSITVTNIYFWFLVAIIFSLANDKEMFSELKNKSSDLSKIVFIGALILLSFYAIFGELNKVKAEYYYNQALIKIEKREYFTAIVLRDYLLETSPNLAMLDYYERGLSLRFIENLSITKRETDVIGILGTLKLAEKNLFENKFESLFVRGFIFGVKGDIFKMNNIFEKLSTFTPEMPKIYLAWGDSLAINQQNKEAFVKFQTALNLLPDINQGDLTTEEKERITRYQAFIEKRLEKIKF